MFLLSVYQSRTQNVQSFTKGRNETMMNEEMSFTVLDENGRETKCDIFLRLTVKKRAKVISCTQIIRLMKMVIRKSLRPSTTRILMSSG